MVHALEAPVDLAVVKWRDGRTAGQCVQHAQAFLVDLGRIPDRIEDSTRMLTGSGRSDKLDGHDCLIQFICEAVGCSLHFADDRGILGVQVPVRVHQSLLRQIAPGQASRDQQAFVSTAPLICVPVIPGVPGHLEREVALEPDSAGTSHEAGGEADDQRVSKGHGAHGSAAPRLSLAVEDPLAEEG